MPEIWFVYAVTNNPNARTYNDMLADIREIKDGVFTCTMKLNNSVVCDYVIIEEAIYADPAGTKVDRVAR